MKRENARDMHYSSTKCVGFSLKQRGEERRRLFPRQTTPKAEDGFKSDTVTGLVLLNQKKGCILQQRMQNRIKLCIGSA